MCVLEDSRIETSSDLIPKYCATAFLSTCSLCRKRATSSEVLFNRDLLIRYFIPCNGAEDEARVGWSVVKDGGWPGRCDSLNALVLAS